MLLEMKQEPLSNYGLNLNHFSYFIMHIHANCCSKAFLLDSPHSIISLIYEYATSVCGNHALGPSIAISVKLLFFNISCMLKMEKEEPIYMCIYNGEIGGPN